MVCTKPSCRFTLEFKDVETMVSVPHSCHFMLNEDCTLYFPFVKSCIIATSYEHSVLEFNDFYLKK
jgi:hypothetical protein